MIEILGQKSIPNIPWQDRPAICHDPLWRFSRNPVIDKNPIKSSPRIYNSAVVCRGGAFVGVFRADHRDYIPRLHFGRSRDAIDWDIEPEPIEMLDEKGNPVSDAYAYDPRVVEIEGVYYVTWCAENHGPTIGIARTSDFKTFTRLENAFLPFNRNGVLFPRKVGGNYLMLSRPSDQGHTPFGDIFLSESPDMIHWGRHRHVMSPGTDGWWDDVKIGAGPIPIETSAGWLLIYHGVASCCNGYIYSIGGVILDRDEPARVLYRSKGYLIQPEESYEIAGLVPNVLFPCATLVDSDTGRMAIYYGAADTYTCLAFGFVEELVKYIIEDTAKS